MADETTDSLVTLRVGNSRFTIGEYVTGGSFGRLHLGTDTKTNQKVAIKLEKQTIDKPQLYLEFGFYRNLGTVRFIPKILYFGPCKEWSALVMELLGPSLLSMNQKCGGTFSLMTTTHLSMQMLTIFEYVHTQSLIYRDVKPENFLFGQPNTDKWCTVNLIDLGFCKKYLDEQNRHIEFKEGKCITGTVRYISVNNHQGRELSRRDDLEAVFYMMVFLHKGELPWQGVQADNLRERYRQIGAIKSTTQGSELCANMPSEYLEWITQVRALQFEDRPKYSQLVAMFRNVLYKLGTTPEEQIYDWDRAQVPKKPDRRL